jgi:hypothetical protein
MKSTDQPPPQLQQGIGKVGVHILQGIPPSEGTQLFVKPCCSSGPRTDPQRFSTLHICSHLCSSLIPCRLCCSLSLAE